MAAPSEPDFAAAEDASPGSEPDFGAAAATEKEPRLYVGNLNFRTEDQDLFEIFSEFGGVVDAHHVNDRFDPDRKRGFGFVTMETTAAAEAAVEARERAAHEQRVQADKEKKRRLWEEELERERQYQKEQKLQLEQEGG